eukprot:1344763-Amorphochlora_amoeboformis.AAC.1
MMHDDESVSKIERYNRTDERFNLCKPSAINPNLVVELNVNARSEVRRLRFKIKPRPPGSVQQLSRIVALCPPYVGVCASKFKVLGYVWLPATASS